jgi:hypothetical protein
MSVKLEQHVAALEQKVAVLQQGRNKGSGASTAWIDDLYGKFAADPVFDQAMKLGAKYRRSLRPRVRRTKPKR